MSDKHQCYRSSQFGRLSLTDQLAFVPTVMHNWTWTNLASSVNCRHKWNRMHVFSNFESEYTICMQMLFCVVTRQQHINIALWSQCTNCWWLPLCCCVHLTNFATCCEVVYSTTAALGNQNVRERANPHHLRLTTTTPLRQPLFSTNLRRTMLD